MSIAAPQLSQPRPLGLGCDLCAFLMYSGLYFSSHAEISGASSFAFSSCLIYTADQ